MTVKAALRTGRQTLPTSDAPDLDAAWLLQHILQLPEAASLYAHSDEPITATQQGQYERSLRQRALGMPLAYLLGEWEFYGRLFTITPDVLIPRPSTEALIDEARLIIERQAHKKKRPLVVADVGTGSGCIAITLALETTPAHVAKIYATDISQKALRVAEGNAERHSVTDRIQFVFGDMLENIADKNIDLIVSNPPYVPTAELESPTSPETRGLSFEPRIALDGGPDGSNYIQQLQVRGIPAIIEVQQGDIQVFNLK